jgi:hypothetical protein
MPRADHIKQLETLAKQGWPRESLDGRQLRAASCGDEIEDRMTTMASTHFIY